jgi:hypothetical protein
MIEAKEILLAGNERQEKLLEFLAFRDAEAVQLNAHVISTEDADN